MMKMETVHLHETLEEVEHNHSAEAVAAEAMVVIKPTKVALDWAQTKQELEKTT